MLGSESLGTTIPCGFSRFPYLSRRTVILCHHLAPRFVRTLFFLRFVACRSAIPAGAAAAYTWRSASCCCGTSGGLALMHLHPSLFALFALTTFLMAGNAPAQPKLAASGCLVVANQGDHTLLVLDLATQKQIASVEVGVNGHEVAVSPDEKI